MLANVTGFQNLKINYHISSVKSKAKMEMCRSVTYNLGVLIYN